MTAFTSDDDKDATAPAVFAPTTFPSDLLKTGVDWRLLNPWRLRHWMHTRQRSIRVDKNGKLLDGHVRYTVDYGESRLRLMHAAGLI